MIGMIIRSYWRHVTFKIRIVLFGVIRILYEVIFFLIS